MEPKDVIQIPTMKDFFELRDKLNLTDRQKTIFYLKFSRGWRNIDIAEELQVNQDTVSDDLKIIRRKLAVVAKYS